MEELRNMARVTFFGSRKAGASLDIGRDLQSLSGKVVLITGAAGDLGRNTAIEIARHCPSARIYVADLPRDAAAKKAVVDSIVHEASGTKTSDGGKTDAPKPDIRYLELDLTSFESIKACANEFAAQEGRLDILLLNAGIIRVAPGTTKEGYEVHFGLNYLGHALLAKLLMPTMIQTAYQQSDADVRIIVVSSEGHTMVPKGGIQFDKLKTDFANISYTARYGQSKLALIGFARELASHQPKIKTAAVHPGRIITGMAASLAKESLLVRLTTPIFAPLVCVPVSVGIKNHLWAIASPQLVSGTYYEPVGVTGKESALAKDKELSRKLWEWTENELKGIGDLRRDGF